METVKRRLCDDIGVRNGGTDVGLVWKVKGPVTSFQSCVVVLVQ